MTYFKPITVLTVCALMLSCQDRGVTPIIIPPVTGLYVDNVTALEGTQLTFTITLNQIDTLDVAVSWNLFDSSAHAGTDYTTSSGTVFIQAGDTLAVVHVATLNDSIIEPGEQFILRLSNSVNAEIGDATGIATIWDDDGVRYAASVKPILVTNCALTDCHGDGSREGGLAMDDASYEKVRHATGDAGPVIVSGRSDKSPLYMVTTPSSLPDIDRMPSGGPYLTTGQQKLIKDWIDQGAQDN